MRFDREKSAGYMTNLTARLFARAMDRRLKAIGLSSGHLPVIFALGDGQELSQKALADYAAIEQPTMAATLSRMERDGLIARRPDPQDGRGSLVSLTEKARGKAEEVRRAAMEINARALGALGPEEGAAYMAAMRRIVEVLRDEEE